MPPLVHKLNNAIGGVAGLADLLVRSPDANTTPQFARTMSEQARVALELLGTLSEVAKDETSPPEPVDLLDVVRRAERFLEPLAESRATELDVRPPAFGAVVRTDPRAFLRDLTVAIGATLVPLGREGGARRRARFRIAPASAGVRVSCLISAGAAELPTLELPARSRTRPGWTRFVWTFASEAIGSSTPEPSGVPALPDRGGASILLSDSDPLLCDLLQSVLGEAGHRVAVAAGQFDLDRQAERFGADLVLLESAADGLGSGPDPAAVAALAGELGRAGHAVALLGSASPPGLPNLQKPFRPGELLGFVDQLLAARTAT